MYVCTCESILETAVKTNRFGTRRATLCHMIVAFQPLTTAGKYLRVMASDEQLPAPKENVKPQNYRELWQVRLLFQQVASNTDTALCPGPQDYIPICRVECMERLAIQLLTT